MSLPDVGSFPGITAEHEHSWVLVLVEHAESGPVREYSCSVCQAVWFD